MKITHRVPVTEVKSDPIDDRYQAEVDRSTNRAEKEFAQTERRWQAAVRRAQRAQEAADAARGSRARVKAAEAAWREVEARDAELARLWALMMPAGASREHRGVKSWRPAPPR